MFVGNRKDIRAGAGHSQGWLLWLCCSEYSPAVPAAKGCDAEPPYCRIRSFWALGVNNKGWSRWFYTMQTGMDAGRCTSVHVGSFSRGRCLGKSWVRGNLTVEREIWAVCFPL